MYQKAIPVLMRAISSMHVGCGQDLGIVDLPIQRESHTGFPKIESSGLKGCFRETFELSAESEEAEINIQRVFGYDQNSLYHYAKASKVEEQFKDHVQYAGALGFTDGRILLFPVRSLQGVFAWATCPRVLERFAEELGICGMDGTTFDFKEKPSSQKAYCSTESVLMTNKEHGQIILEDYSFEAEVSGEVDRMATRLSEQLDKPHLAQRLIVVSDDDFVDFVSMHTEVITRTKINNATGTVQNGALFTEEYLPSETVMYTLALISPTFLAGSALEQWDAGQVEDFFRSGLKENRTVIQIGSGATIGKGLTEVTVFQA